MKRLAVILTVLFVITPMGRAGITIVQINDGLHHLVNNYKYQDDSVYLDSGVINDPGTHLEIVDGGSIDSIYAFNKSSVTVNGGSITYLLCMRYNSIATVNNGFVESLAAQYNSTTTVNGGTIKLLSTNHTSTTIIDNGLISNNIQTHDSSEVTVSGGTVNNYIHAYDNSTITISGGATNNTIISHDSGIINIMGGTINSYFRAYDGTIYLYGNNFSVNNTALSFGDDLRDYGTLGSSGYWLSGPVTGILQDGSLLDTRFSIWADSDAQIIIIPEPATVLLLGSGGLFIRKKRRRGF